MESPKLTTLYDLLAEDYTVAQLATTVEEHGIHGWDRFGRYGEHKTNSPGAEQALDALADFYEKEQDFWERMNTHPPESYEDWEITIASESPLEVAREFQTLAIHHFGWPMGELPYIDRAERYPQIPKRKKHEADPTNLLRIIGALLDFLDSRQRPYKQTEVIAGICSRYPSVHGLAESTLEKWFGAGNRALEEAKK